MAVPSRDYRDAVRATQEAELRKVICGFCGAESRLLDGPSGLAWFRAHQCSSVGVVLQFPKDAA